MVFRGFLGLQERFQGAWQSQRGLGGSQGWFLVVRRAHKEVQNISRALKGVLRGVRGDFPGGIWGGERPRWPPNPPGSRGCPHGGAQIPRERPQTLPWIPELVLPNPWNSQIYPTAPQNSQIYPFPPKPPGLVGSGGGSLFPWLDLIQSGFHGFGPPPVLLPPKTPGDPQTSPQGTQSSFRTFNVIFISCFIFFPFFFYFFSFL